MDLILWRHAEAEDEAPDGDDLRRALTSRGQKQAGRIAAWLDMQLPEGLQIVSSPALRCEQTALALGRKYKTERGISPAGTVEDMLAAAHWPSAKQPVMLIGHQPLIGQTIARLLNVQGGSCAVRKGAVWWLRTRERGGHEQTVVVAVQSPDTV